MVCARCGQSVPDGALYCPWCGKRQNGAAPPQRKKRRRPKGSGSVYRLQGNRSRPWVAMGTGAQLVGTYSSTGEAVRALDAWNVSRTPVERMKYTFANIYERWQPTHFATIGPSGQASYRRAFELAAPLHGRRMAELKTEDYQQIIDGLVAQGRSRSLCDKQRQLFGQLCRYAMQQDIIDKNYAEFITVSVQQQVRDRVFSDEEICRIESHTEDGGVVGRAAQLVTVMLYTGMRVGEVLGMPASQVDLAQHIMVGGEKTDAGRNRSIPIHPRILPIIAAWLHEENGPWLLHTANGTQLSTRNARRDFDKLMAICGIEGATPHTCRHTAASRMVQAGLDPAAVKSILGHADFSTTIEIYTHTDTDYLVNQMDKLA